MSSDNAPAVACPVHGTHGALSHGRCWYCVQSGLVDPSTVPTPPETEPPVEPPPTT